jgi:hypothetical protein
MNNPAKIAASRLRSEPVTSTIYIRNVNAYVNLPGDGYSDRSFMSPASKCTMFRLTSARGTYLCPGPSRDQTNPESHSQRLPDVIYPEVEWLERQANNSHLISRLRNQLRPLSRTCCHHGTYIVL